MVEQIHVRFILSPSSFGLNVLFFVSFTLLYHQLNIDISLLDSLRIWFWGCLFSINDVQRNKYLVELTRKTSNIYWEKNSLQRLKTWHSWSITCFRRLIGWRTRSRWRVKERFSYDCYKLKKIMATALQLVLIF